MKLVSLALAALAAAGCVHVDELDAALADADYVLVGERHDHPGHHQLQAKILARWIELGGRPVVAFEQLDSSQQAALDAHLAAHPRDAAGVGAAVGWDKSGWPPWNTYQPIAEVALGAGLPLVPALFPKAEVRGIYKEGVGKMFDAEAQRLLALDAPEDARVESELTRAVVEGHCNELDAEAAQPMVTIQKARDAEMARRLVERGRGRGAFLVTGLQHARRDLGVPRYLLRLQPEAKIVSVGLVEKTPGMQEPSPEALDVVIYTEALPEKDHCAELRGKLQKRGR